MPLLFIFVVGIAVALVRRLVTVPGDQTYNQDAPARLLGWAIGLLAAQREQWGQAMIGELDRLDCSVRRWRFALGALMAVAASAGGLVVYTHIHYQLGTHVSPWVLAAILVLILVPTSLAAARCYAARGLPDLGWSVVCS
jgi:hypothetical protein